MNTPPGEMAIAHISDLHLHPPLTQSGERLITRLGIKTHAYYKLKAAAAALSNIAARAQPRPLVCCVTGDITTEGHPAAFHYSRQLLERKTVKFKGSDCLVGLNLRIPGLVVPGNHDRYEISFLKRQNTVFEEAFHDYLSMDNWDRYGLNPPSRSTHELNHLPYVRVVEDGASNQSIVFIGVDSTFVPWWNILAKAAKGRVVDNSLRYIRNVTEDINDHNTVTASDGTEYDLSARQVTTVLLLHHHPYVPSSPGKPSLGDLADLTTLVNADEVRNVICECKIDLVLYGHEHVSFVDVQTLQPRSDNPHSVLFGAAGSLSVFDDPTPNSFNIYYLNGGALHFQVWRFDGRHFTPHSSGTRQLN